MSSSFYVVTPTIIAMATDVATGIFKGTEEQVRSMTASARNCRLRELAPAKGMKCLRRGYDAVFLVISAAHDRSHDQTSPEACYLEEYYDEAGWPLVRYVTRRVHTCPWGGGSWYVEER